MIRRICALAAAAASLALAPGAHAATTVIETRDVVYSPESATVKVGEKVTWTNTGKAPHNVVSTDGTLDSGNMDPGVSWSYTPTKAGTLSYYCTYHGTATSGMRATLVVAAAAGSTAGGTGGHPRTGGGREVQLGLGVLLATAVLGLGLRAAGRTR